MSIPNRADTKAQTATTLDTVDAEIVHQIGVRQLYVADKYDTDGHTIVTARDQTTAGISALTVDQVKLITSWLDQLDNIGPDTTEKVGGADGVNYRPTRDADLAEISICQMVYNRRDPLTGGGPYFG